MPGTLALSADFTHDVFNSKHPRAGRGEQTERWHGETTVGGLGGSVDSCQEWKHECARHAKD